MLFVCRLHFQKPNSNLSSSSGLVEGFLRSTLLLAQEPMESSFGDGCRVFLFSLLFGWAQHSRQTLSDLGSMKTTSLLWEG